MKIIRVLSSKITTAAVTKSQRLRDHGSSKFIIALSQITKKKKKSQNLKTSKLENHMEGTWEFLDELEIPDLLREGNRSC